jgi:hypothetical protein
LLQAFEQKLYLPPLPVNISYPGRFPFSVIGKKLKDPFVLPIVVGNQTALYLLDLFISKAHNYRLITNDA